MVEIFDQLNPFAPNLRYNVSQLGGYSLRCTYYPIPGETRFPASESKVAHRNAHVNARHSAALPVCVVDRCGDSIKNERQVQLHP